IGQKYRGNLGGTIATLGVVFPSLVIITIIAAFLTNFAEIPVVQHALAGINAAVVAMIAVSVLKLGKSTVKDAPSVCIFLAVLVLSELGGLLGVDVSTPLGQALDLLSSPAVLVVLAGITGLLLARLSGKQKREGEETCYSCACFLNLSKPDCSPSAEDWAPSPSSRTWERPPAGLPTRS